MTEQFVTDKLGRQYELSIEEHDGYTDFTIDHDDVWIGKASCKAEGQFKWRLLEINIRDDVPVRQSFLVRQLRQFFRRGVKRRSYRHLGLGDALMNCVVARARLMGFKAIRGSVVDQDIEQTPYLVAWYQKHGFRLVEPGSGDISRTVVQKTL